MSGTSVPYSKVSRPEPTLHSPFFNYWDESQGTQYGYDLLEEVF